MNKVVLIGRLTRDPELRHTGQGTAVASFSIAVNRRKQKDKPQEADFIRCVAWGATGENLAKYQSKGSQIAVHGRIQTGSYEDKDGKKVYTTDVIAEEIEFLGSKKSSDGSNYSPQEQEFDGFTPIEDNDDDLPF